MLLHIPRFGSLLVVETTQEQIDNSLTGNIWVLTNSVIEALAVSLMMTELKMTPPVSFLGIPYNETVEKLWATAHILYVRQQQIDYEMTRFRNSNHFLKSAMFKLGLIEVEELLAES